MGCKESDLTEQLTLLVNLTLISLYSPSVQLLGGMAVASLVFKEIAINFFQSGCAILPLQQQCMRDPACPYSHQDLVLSLFFHFCCSVAQLSPTLCHPMDCSLPGFPVHHQVPELAQTHVHWLSDAIQPPHPLSAPFSPAFNLPRIRIFSNESVLCIRCPKYWSFSFGISPSKEYSGLISFRIDWFDQLGSALLYLSP